MPYTDVNGLAMSYEEHGGGDSALILLHGGYGSGEVFQPIVPALAEGRRVMTVDLQGHGRTADIDRPLRFESMADDIAAFIAGLGSQRVDLMGYSLGGGVALRTAIQHPGVLRRLVLVSVPFRRDGWFPEVREAMRKQSEPDFADMLRRSPLYEDYARLAPRAEDWRTLVSKTAELLSLDYDWTTAAAAMSVPALLVYADADSISTAHMAECYGLLGGGRRDAGWEGSGLLPRSSSQLAVLPGQTHYDVLTSSAFTGAVNAFLSRDS
jgi:pimeloyl-ACP methyl ester carboxylesterase